MMKNEKLHNFLVNDGLSDEEYNCIRNDVVEGNKLSMNIACFATISLSAILLIISLVSNVLGNPWYIYAIALGAGAICLVLNKTIVKKGSKTLKWLIYLLVATLLGIGLALGTCLNPDSEAVTFICFLLLLPLLFVDRCYRECLFILLMMIVFYVVAYFTKDRNVFITDVINVSIFGLVSFIGTSFLGIGKIQSYWMSYLLKHSATHDALTGVKNRTSFEAELPTYPQKIESNISCVYIDLNGLHVINNEQGHAAGDEMLKCISKIVEDEIKTDNVYRTGGDEFVAFMLDLEREKILDIANNIKHRVDGAGYSVSIGVETMIKPELNMNVLIAKSEQYMYQNKENYYKEKGLEMRNENRS